MQNTIIASVTKLVNSGMVKKENLQGCTISDISELEKKFDVKLPNNYIEFLKILGKRSDGFLQGTDFLYDKLFKLKQYAIDLLKENKANYVLGKDDFVFMSHQGYQFLFFKCNDDKAIYCYEDGDSNIQKVYDNFEEWFSDTCNDEIETYKSFGQ